LKQFQGEASLRDLDDAGSSSNLCLDQLRKQSDCGRSRLSDDEELGGVERQCPWWTPNPTERLRRGELRQRIDEALTSVHEHRTVLILHEF